mgnify:CR=1 FL=1
MGYLEGYNKTNGTNIPWKCDICGREFDEATPEWEDADGETTYCSNCSEAEMDDAFDNIGEFSSIMDDKGGGYREEQ